MATNRIQRKRARRSTASRRQMARNRAMRAARARAMARRRFAEPVDPDMEPMVDEFLAPEPAITDDTAPIEQVSGQGTVSDDLVEPEMAGDSEAPVQDSVTARRRRARAAARRRAMMRRRRAQEDAGADFEDETIPTDDEIVEAQEDANEEAPEIIEDEKKRDEDIIARFSAASRLAELQKAKGCIPRTASTARVAERIARRHTKAEINFAIANLVSAGKAQPKKASADKMPRRAPKRTAAKRAPRQQRKASSGTDAAALFM